MNWFNILLISLTLVCGAVYLFYDKILAKVSENSRFTLKILHELKTSFWILFFVFFFRSFLFEPFQIPTGSMIPTVVPGDFVVVSKYSYGIRMPLTNQVIIPTGDVKRGDVVVFLYPEDKSISYIKRVVGLPGDVVLFDGRTLTINDQIISTIQMSESEDFSVLHEYLTDTPHLVQYGKKFRLNINASWKVPEGKYFVMGDNRDNSSDSRYFGFVDDSLIQGKALAVWMHWLDWKSFPRLNNIRVID